MRFNDDMIQEWIGKKFVKYKCDPFNVTNSATQIVGLYIGDEIYSLTNIQEAVDYFGISEDMSVFKIIQRGHDLIDKISDNDDFLQEWDEEYSPEYKRDVLVIK
ncbi:hypothetical protein [Lachnobacterium bovis]|uniref:hypothetical protein n=1 Tax=Lachnobacterium bovis TaxID=140626 RepID=UPI0012DCD0DF|nr:hypothetical protein [Lachnobacterium bovis]